MEGDLDSAERAGALEELFAPGRNGTEALRRARAGNGALVYDVKWRKQADQRDNINIVADRGYNVASISRRLMGSSAVQQVAEDGLTTSRRICSPRARRPGWCTPPTCASLRDASTWKVIGVRPTCSCAQRLTATTVTPIAGEMCRRVAAPLIAADQGD